MPRQSTALDFTITFGCLGCMQLDLGLYIENWTDQAKVEGENYELSQKCEIFKILWFRYFSGTYIRDTEKINCHDIPNIYDLPNFSIVCLVKWQVFRKNMNFLTNKAKSKSFLSVV